jgi:hypothetical protein
MHMETAMRRLIALASLVLVPGCATIIEGGAQSVSISTTPAGAICNVDRAGTHLGTVATTPGSLRFDKSKNDITVSCAKEGYQTASVTESPKFVGTTFGNIVAGGLIGVAVDAATGANYTYPGEVRLDLAPAIAALPATPIVPASSGPVAADLGKRL